MLRAICGAIFGVVLMLAAGCRSGGGTADRSAVPGEVKTFPIRGRVVSVDTAKGSVLLDHEAVQGFMEAMTMSYKVQDGNVAAELHPSDRIVAKLVVHKTPEGYVDPELAEIVVTAQAKPDYVPKVHYHVPNEGDVVPDFKFRNQSGKTIRLGQFKGRVLLLTFVYTRCPLADFCPRMSRNFAEVDKALAADAALYGKTHLLSISFDPGYDTPAVLRSYGGSYTGRFTKETFEHWDFAAPREDELAAVTQWFNVGIQPMAGSDSGLTHSLSTVLVGKDGRVVAWYPSNDWTVAEVVAAMRRAAGER